jgi:hypothetical protein
MSARATGWAMDARRTGHLDPAVRLVLLALADRAGDDGRHSWPAVATLAEQLGISERAIRRSLSVLVDARLISRGDQALVGHIRADRRPTVWDLDVTDTRLRGDDTVTPPASRGDETVRSSRPRGDDHDMSIVTPRGDDLDRHGVTISTPRNQKLEQEQNPTPPYSPPPALPGSADPLVAAAVVANDVDPRTGAHRRCGHIHPAGLSCPQPAAGRPPDWAERVEAARAAWRAAGDGTGAWDACPACGGPTLADLCDRCRQATITAPTLDLIGVGS